MQNSIGKRNTSQQGRFTKREFLKVCGGGLGALCAAHFLLFPEGSSAQAPQKGLIKTKLSPYFESLDGGKVQCTLCPRQCHVASGERGSCRVRENRNGKLYSLVYGNPCVLHLDPIEKEPFLHVLPGTRALTISTAGCTFECKSCENWEISQASPEDVYSYDLPPEMVIHRARQMGARSVSYTYAEPTIYYEFMWDTARLARKAGLLNLMHSNGFINPAPLQKLCTVLDAVQIDLKGFTDSSYRELSNGELTPVLQTLKTLKQAGVHLEITYLMIPTKNDERSEIEKMCEWIRSEIGSHTPTHFTRFYPLYKLQRLPSTPVASLEEARRIALAAGLEYVYIGRVPGHTSWHTTCPACSKRIIQRIGYMIGEIGLEDGKCRYCGKPIPGLWA